MPAGSDFDLACTSISDELSSDEYKEDVRSGWRRSRRDMTAEIGRGRWSLRHRDEHDPPGKKAAMGASVRSEQGRH